MKQATEIKANAIYRVKSQNCWMVPSDTSSKMYKVCFNDASSNWTCECRHGEVQAERGLAAHCKHVAAVQISIKANLKQEQEAYASRLHNGVTLDKFNADVERENSEESLARREQESRERLPLHRNNTPLEAAPSGRLVPMR